MSQENKISFTVSNVPSKKNHVIDGMIALKKIQHFSYALTDQIGLGYSSHVYRGKNDKTNQLVAIKVIDITKEDQLHKQFTNDQVKILEKIKNACPQHLLRLEGVFKTKNNLYIITEFCQGKDLAKILRKNKIFSQQESHSIMKQFLKGYGQLYRLQVVHRDLKLANIFVRKGRLVLADFGFAIDADRCAQKFDYNVGSPFYMPPESLKYNRYSYKSDVWAIGVIGFQLIYGHRPWKDKDDDVLFEKITNIRIDELFDPSVKVSENYKQFIRQCLKIDYERRATPEYVINFQWSKAGDYIDGLDQNHNHQPRTISISKIPHNMYPASAKHVNYKPIQFQDIRQNKLARNKNTEAPFSLMPVRQTSPFQQNQEQRKRNVSGGSLAQKRQSKKQGYYQYQAKRVLRQNTIDHPGHQIQNTEDNSSKDTYSQIVVQKAIVSQIQYCRFLNLVFEQITASGLEQLRQLSMQVSKKLLDKMQLLSRLQIQQGSQSIPGLKRYIAGDRWRTLAQIISSYKEKYSQKYSNYQQRQVPNLQTDSICKSISFLKNKIRQYQRLIELLVYLFQVMQIESKSNLIQFSTQSKIQCLAENRSITQSEANTQRLVKKLEYFDF